MMRWMSTPHKPRTPRPQLPQISVLLSIWLRHGLMTRSRCCSRQWCVGSQRVRSHYLRPDSCIVGLLLTSSQSGMHKHFRMLAISEHLRTNGYDPAVYTHIRIPGIWKKLNEFYNMPLIDERENTMDLVEDPNFDDRFKDFDLPWEDYGDLIMQRALADPSEAPSSPSTTEKSPASTRKRKRGGAGDGPKTRSSTVEDSEAENEADAEEAQSSPAMKSARSARSTRSSKRAASKAKAKPVEREEAEGDDEEQDGDGDADGDSPEEEDDDDDGNDSEEQAEEQEEEQESEEAEEEQQEEEAPAVRPTRGGPGRGRKRGRGRGRGRGRRGG